MNIAQNYAYFGYNLSVSLIGTFFNPTPLLFPTFLQFPVYQIALPLHVHLFSFILLALATPLFWCSQNCRGQFLFFNFENDRVTPKDPALVRTVLLYAALFYLLPSAEYYLELVYFPDLKSSSVWTSFGLSSFFAKGFGGQQQWPAVVFMTSGCFVFCTMMTLFTAAYLLRAGLVLDARQLADLLAMLELVMHLSSQVQYCEIVKMFSFTD